MRLLLWNAPETALSQGLVIARSAQYSGLLLDDEKTNLEFFLTWFDPGFPVYFSQKAKNLNCEISWPTWLTPIVRLQDYRDLEKLKIFLESHPETQLVFNAPLYQLNHLIKEVSQWGPREISIEIPFSVQPFELSAWIYAIEQIKSNYPKMTLNPPLRGAYLKRDSAFNWSEVSLIWQQQNELPVDFSIVVPVHNHWPEVLLALPSWLESARQQSKEIILIDDGSDEDLESRKKVIDILVDSAVSASIYILPRTQARAKGDGEYRAGFARNIGASQARGEYLVFIDADIILPDNYFSILRQECHEARILMAPRDHINIQNNKTSPSSEIFWLAFEKQASQWQDLEQPWRYVCTHNLCIAKSRFWMIGGFFEGFTHWGFEDVELGYQHYFKQGKFFALPIKVLHIQGPIEKAEHQQNKNLKRQLLLKSAEIFYRQTLSKEVYQAIEYLIRPKYILSKILDVVENHGLAKYALKIWTPVKPFSEVHRNSSEMSVWN